jgi:hypothetical protein
MRQRHAKGLAIALLACLTLALAACLGGCAPPDPPGEHVGQTLDEVNAGVPDDGAVPPPITTPGPRSRSRSVTGRPTFAPRCIASTT